MDDRAHCISQNQVLEGILPQFVSAVDQPTGRSDGMSRSMRFKTTAHMLQIVPLGWWPNAAN